MIDYVEPQAQALGQNKEHGLPHLWPLGGEGGAKSGRSLGLRLDLDEGEGLGLPLAWALGALFCGLFRELLRISAGVMVGIAVVHSEPLSRPSYSSGQDEWTRLFLAY